MNETELEEGDFARDELSDDGDDRVLVTEVLDETAEDHVIFTEPNGREHTVANHTSNVNRYDPDAQVVKAVYVESLSRELDAWTVDGVLALRVDDDLPVKEYPFPHDRLSALQLEEA